ncbi:MAG: alpha-amylase, partial [Cyclobacteriaceae bacterium]|nr:alpha-amylase [Cyclobacteriaceae bacterium]
MAVLRILGTAVIELLLITSCTVTSMNEEKGKANVWPNGTMYEIFVQSYADSNGDGIGDFNGLTSKLDYIQSLGIQGLWLMPFHPSPSYHKYDVTNYYGIHPNYGTMEDFKHFLEEAHKRNIKVVMDLVVNHTSWEHPWFVSARKSKSSPYR